MLGKFKTWFGSLPTWVAASVFMATCCVGLLIVCIYLIAIFSSGWVFILTVFGVIYYCCYEVVNSGRKTQNG